MSASYHETWEQGRKVIKKKKGRRQPIKYYRRCPEKNCSWCAAGRQHKHKRRAAMVEMADTGDLKSPAQ